MTYFWLFLTKQLPRKLKEKGNLFSLFSSRLDKTVHKSNWMSRFARFVSFFRQIFVIFSDNYTRLHLRHIHSWKTWNLNIFVTSMLWKPSKFDLIFITLIIKISNIYLLLTKRFENWKISVFLFSMATLLRFIWILNFRANSCYIVINMSHMSSLTQNELNFWIIKFHYNYRINY